MRRIFFLGVAMLGFAGLAVPQALPPIFIQQTLTQSFGMVGLTAGQTAQLNLWNSYFLPAPYATSALCVAQVAFLDGTGKVLKTGSISVAPGGSASYDLNRDTDLTSETVLRLPIRATISTSLPRGILTPIANPGVIPSPTPTPAPNPGGAVSPLPFPFQAVCNLFPTLEVFDNSTGKTLVVLETTRAVENNVFPPPLPTPLVPTPTTGGN